MKDEVTISHDFFWEAAHWLPNVGPDHKCHRMHGHSYMATVFVTGPIDPVTGWVMEFHDITEVVTPVIRSLDHHVLNDVPGLENPTVEVLARWLFRTLQGRLPRLTGVHASETRGTGASYSCTT